MFKAFFFGAVAAGAFSGVAAAGEGGGAMSYSYFEAGYVHEQIDDLPGHDPGGVGFGASFAVAPNLHGFAEYSNLTYSGITLQSLETGLGLNFSVAPQIDLIARGAYVRAKIEDFSYDGFGVQAGVRVQPVSVVELEALLHYVDINDAGHTTSGKLAARYYFMPQLAVGAGLEYDNDGRTWQVGLRYTFR